MSSHHHIKISKSILDDILGVISIFQDIFLYLITIKKQILVQLDVGDLYTVSYQINNSFRLFILESQRNPTFETYDNAQKFNNVGFANY
jgi:hypothetical protein